MKFDQPASANPSDRKAVLSKPFSRIDGPLKTTGTAPYAYERHNVVEGQLVGYPLFSAIAKGRIGRIDKTRAEKAPGVRAVVLTTDMEALPQHKTNVVPLFGGDEINHYHQAVALVVADTFEQARAAANLIEIDYDSDVALSDLEVADQRKRGEDKKPEQDVGDFSDAFEKAAHRLDATYRTPGQSHAMMEPHASVAAWDGELLTLWTSSQMVDWHRSALAQSLDIDKEQVRVDSPYIGGGFGGKLFLRADAVLAALGARAAGQPVKVTLPRPAIINNTTHRSATIQRIRIGTDNDGHITAIGHDNISYGPEGGDGEDATSQSQEFYAGEHRLIINRFATLGLPESNAMRAPGETSGLMALEIAMDEMAEKVGLDPVEFRIRNDVQVHPGKPDKPFSDRNFIECLKTGSDKFGWENRNASPGATRDGDWLIGHGMAGAYRGSPTETSGARVSLTPQGRAIVETDMTDIGTGSYTIIAQTTAEMLGLNLDAVEVRLGDSRFPVSSGSGGQFGAASATAGVYAACVKLREKIASLLQASPESLTFRDGAVSVDDETPRPLTEILSDQELVAEDTMEFGDFKKGYKVSTFGAHFVEVAVHRATGETRVRRMLAVCDSGRILNPVTARSQVIGAMTMGVGAALSEELSVDTGRGFFVNHDLAGYEVPVHADIPEQEVIFLDSEDPISTPLKAKGVGELGLCGVSAAILNAVHNATGIRIRDYPLRLDKLIGELPPLERH